MDAFLLVAAGLAVFLAAAHSYLGERYIIIRLRKRPDLPKIFGSSDFTKQVLRFAWHLTSVAWAGLAAVLVSLAGTGATQQAVIRIVAATFGASGVVALVGSRGRHPSWVVFLAIATLTWFSSR